MNFINVVPFFPEKIDFMAEEALRMAEKTGILKFGFSMSLHPQNLDVMAKPLFYKDAFEQLQKKLEGKGLEVGILIQSLVGHGWSGQMICKQPWQYTINITGQTAYRHCMLDEGFQNYVSQTMAMLSACRPAFFLVDDDLRLLNNSCNGPECFCPLHMKLFNEASDKKFTADELREHLKNSRWDDPYIKIFETIRRKTLLDFAHLIRDAIDSVDSSIECGYCAGGAEYIMMGEIARVLAGKNRSFLRIHNSNFSEGDPQDFIKVAYHTAFCVKAAGKVDDLLDESDTCPHDRYSKSAISMHAHITGGILNGLTGAKLWISNMQYPTHAANPPYEEILGSHRKFYDTLQNEVAQLKWQGALTILPDAGYHYTPARFSSFYSWRDWQTFMLNRYGIPGRFDEFESGSVVLLTGDMLEYLSDEKLKEILSGKALLDGYAALGIAERGLASMLGVKPVQEEYRSSFERIHSTGEQLRYINNFTFPKLTEPAPGAVELSELRLADFQRSPHTEYVAPGSVYYENSAGGKIITVAMGIATLFLNGPGCGQKYFLLEMLKKLDPSILPVWSISEQPVYLRCGLTKDGSYLVALVNLSFDSLKTIDLACSQMPAAVEILAGDGTWQKSAFETISNGLSVPRQLHCYEPVILKLKF